MRIIQLKTENVKKVKAIEITPKTDVVIISGNNGQGKTSVLDSIWYALQGRTGLKGTPMPIRKGEKKASVTLRLIDDETKEVKFIVTRSWTADNKSYLKVTNAEGLTYNSPQELLDSFIGELTFDPLEFAQMKDKDQRQLLLKLAKVDIDSLDVNINELKEERRLQGQTVRLYEGERDTRDFSEIPTEGVSIEKLQKNVEKAIELNRNIDDSKQKVDRLETTILNWEARIESLKEEIQKAKEEENFELKYLESTTMINVEGIRNKLNKALEINELVQAKNRNILADKKRDEAQKVYDNFTTRIGAVTVRKVQALQRAKMPIEGLSVNDTGVIYNDIPFSQLSSSEQLKVSMAIAIALNPNLRVIRVVDGSLLDDENMKLIREMAKGKNMQIWIERVNDSSELAFIIENGEVKNG